MLIKTRLILAGDLGWIDGINPDTPFRRGLESVEYCCDRMEEDFLRWRTIYFSTSLDEGLVQDVVEREVIDHCPYCSAEVKIEHVRTTRYKKKVIQKVDYVEEEVEGQKELEQESGS